VFPEIPLKVELATVLVLVWPAPKLPPVPEIIVHCPVLPVGVFPARVTVVNPQVASPVWSGPASATFILTTIG